MRVIEKENKIEETNGELRNAEMYAEELSQRNVEYGN